MPHTSPAAPNIVCLLPPAASYPLLHGGRREHGLLFAAAAAPPSTTTTTVVLRSADDPSNVGRIVTSEISWLSPRRSCPTELFVAGVDFFNG